MKRFLPFFVIIFLTAGVFAQVGTLTVTVLSSEVETGFTVIEYEFTGPAEAYDITAEVSFDKGTEFTDIPKEDLSGDLTNVNPGGPYTITWDGMASFDDTYSEETVIGLHAQCILPDAPTTKPATGTSANSFTANWTEVPGAITYTLDVALDADFTDIVPGYEQVEVVGTTSHTVVGLASHTIHYYRVQAVDVCGTSDYSDVECVFTADPFVCGDPVMFKYRSQCIVYGTIERGGLCWMDRNLGASRVATSSTDAEAYGDLFQWGRLDDGHQDRESESTPGPVNQDVPGHGDFLTVDGSTDDWRSPQNNDLWQGTEGTNNPCPAGWRVPTEDELEAERASWSPPGNPEGPFESDLKWTFAGRRLYNNSFIGAGDQGNVWSSDVTSTRARALTFTSIGIANTASFGRADGLTVRCVRNLGN